MSAPLSNLASLINSAVVVQPPPSVSGYNRMPAGNISLTSLRTVGSPLTTLDFLGVSQPAAAASAGMNRLVLYDDFTSLSAVDLTDSRATGFLWYTHNQWLNCHEVNWQVVTKTNVSAITISGSTVTINNTDATNYPIASFFTGATTGGTTYVGQSFTGGWYAECNMSFDPSLSQGGFTSWPIFWSIASDFLTGASANGPFAELDFFEAFRGSGTITPLFSSFHDWLDGTGTTDNSNTNNVWTPPGGTDFTQKHKFGLLWVPMAKNSGTGLIQHFFDGVHQTAQDVSYSATSGSSPPATPSNPAGVFSIMDTQNHFISVGCGPNWPNLVDYIQVWQY